MRTKIVCTLGPSTDDDDVMRAVMRAGMDVARLNFSHGTHADHARRIQQVRRLTAELGAHVAIMGDLQGPKFRIGDLTGDGLTLHKADVITLFSGRDYDSAHPQRVPFPHPEVLAVLQPGNRLLIDDGVITLVVLERSADGVRCAAENDCKLLARKGVSAPGVNVAVSSITEKDRVDLQFACAQQIEAIALSFVRAAGDVRELRELITAAGGDQLIVAKIEKPEALKELDAIIKASDVIMVARGDLGVEAPPEEVPFYQKRIIRHARRAGKPVITATQMLQSMVRESAPTRAEATDVANAVLDGTDAVMLSAETASGAHPVAAVEAMARIAQRAENHAIRRNGWPTEHTHHDAEDRDTVTDAITHSAVTVAREVGAKAIVCGTRSGLTSRMVSRHRPHVPTLSLTTTPRALHYSTFMWGMEGVIEASVIQDAELMYQAAGQLAKSRGLAASGDRIVVVLGWPLGGGAGHTNMIKVQVVA
jgi:pyruvate kinase